jgi:hypothetical protein
MSKIPPRINPKVGRAKPALGNSTTGVGVVPAMTVVGVGVAFGPGVLVGPGVGVEVGPGVGVAVGPGQLQFVSLVQSRFRQWEEEQIKLPLH